SPPACLFYLFFLFPESPSLKIRIVILRLHLIGIIGTGGLCRGIEHIGSDPYRRFVLERQHPAGSLAAKHHGGGKGEILHTACKIEIHNGLFISLHRDTLLKLPGDILMAGCQGDKSCNQQHHRKSIKNCGKDSSFFRGLCDWIAVHLHQCALLSLREALRSEERRVGYEGRCGWCWA